MRHCGPSDPSFISRLQVTDYLSSAAGGQLRAYYDPVSVFDAGDADWGQGTYLDEAAVQLGRTYHSFAVPLETASAIESW